MTNLLLSALFYGDEQTAELIIIDTPDDFAGFDHELGWTSRRGRKRRLAEVLDHIGDPADLVDVGTGWDEVDLVGPNVVERPQYA